MKNSGAIDVKTILDMVPGLDLKQNGQSGQSTSLFMRGTNSNHTLVLLNGIAINDLSTTCLFTQFWSRFCSNNSTRNLKDPGHILALQQLVEL